MPPKSKTPQDDLTCRYRCTAPCNKKIETTYEANLHPLLGTLICRECYTNYGSGDFTQFVDGVDDNGDDNYCRWCCDGGDLLGCVRTDENGSSCHYSFCSDCVKKNVPDDKILHMKDQEDSDFKWHCFVCDPSRLDRHREEAAAAIKALNESSMGTLRKNDLDERLTLYEQMKKSCIKEIDSKFDLILNALRRPNRDSDFNTLISKEIDSLKIPMQDFVQMLDDMKAQSKLFPL